jgi:hypothetical protein
LLHFLCRAGTNSVGLPYSQATGRQNALAAALKEYGALRRTIYAAKYLSDPDYRRRIARQLNKGESLHALRRDLLYAHEGMIRRPPPRGPDRTSLVSDFGHERRNHLYHRVLRSGGGADAPRGTAER